MQQLRQSGIYYLETILEIERELGEVRSVEIARRTGVSRASVSKAVGALRRAGFVEPAYYGRVSLTDKGRTYAQRSLERRALIARFLRQELGLPDEIAEQDAGRMEHLASEALLSGMRRLLYAAKEETHP